MPDDDWIKRFFVGLAKVIGVILLLIVVAYGLLFGFCMIMSR